MAYKIFISSSYKDIDLARDLERRLEAAGVDAYRIDKIISAGSIEKSIMKNLNDADEIVVILTDKSVANPWLMYEMGAASSLRKRITPVIVGLKPNQLPSIIRNMEYIKYPELPKYISALEKRAKAA
jgi:hypothetical protein